MPPEVSLVNAGDQEEIGLDLQRARVVLKLELQSLAHKFTLHQVGAILDAIHDLSRDVPIEGDLIPLVWCEVLDELERDEGALAKKWLLDHAQSTAIVERLRYSSPAQCWALVHFAERFWNLHGSSDLELTEGHLIDLGLAVAMRPTFCHDLGETQTEDEF